MRTNIDIDEELMRQVLEVTGIRTKKEAVREALQTLLRQRQAHQALMSLRGKVEWEGDLNQMRKNRPSAEGDW